MVRSDQFGRYLAQLQSEADAASLKKQREYDGWFQESLKTMTSGVRVDRSACSANMCMMSLIADADAKGFREWYATIGSKGAPVVPAMTTFSVPLSGGAKEHRLLFTTDRAFSGIMGRSGPPPTIRH